MRAEDKIDNAENGGWLIGNTEGVRETPNPISGGIVSPSVVYSYLGYNASDTCKEQIQRQLSSIRLIQHVQLRCKGQDESKLQYPERKASVDRPG
jgi:hypothetical protein